MIALLGQYRMAVAAVMAVLLLAMATGAGAWLAAGHYRPMLDIAQDDLIQARAARDNLLALTTEQGQALGELVAEANERELTAAQAVKEARAQAEPKHARAVRVMAERTGADAVALSALIDKELGL